MKARSSQESDDMASMISFVLLKRTLLMPGQVQKLGSTGSAGIDADCLFSWVLVEVKERKKSYYNKGLY